MDMRKRHTEIFGELTHLGQHMSWTTGVSNMMEGLVWGTGNVLGVTKTELRTMIVEWTVEAIAAQKSASEASVEFPLHTALPGNVDMDLLHKQVEQRMAAVTASLASTRVTSPRSTLATSSSVRANGSSSPTN